MDLENMKCKSKDEIFHNKCKFCGKDLKPIGLDYLYANIPISSIEYERCDCEKSKAYWNEIDLKEEIQKKMEEISIQRREKQPIDKPSAGSTFKRGEDFITAKLIDEAGLKGFNVGGAEVSNKHAGFVVNTGNATAEDVIQLTNIVKKKVYEKFGKKIELEVEILGE